MTALAFPAVSRSADAFWMANARADARIAEHDRLAVEASFAPPVTTSASCPCGSVFEARGNRIELTEIELAAAMGTGYDADAINLIVAAINRHRETETYTALQDWRDYHDYCGEEL